MKYDGAGKISPLLPAITWCLGMGSVAVLALALCSRYFQPWLSADYIYPQLFAEDLLSGRYPLSGWTLSSAPYFFPDMAVITLLRAIGGPGTALPAYVVFSYFCLAIVSGWSLQRITRGGAMAWLAGIVFVDALLLWQPVGDHAHYLWLFGTVGFHGGAVLLGLVNVALWTGMAPDEKLSRSRRAAALAVLFLGLMSDTLFFIQAALPLGLGLWAWANWNWRRPLVRGYTASLLCSIGLVALVRLGLWAGGWFSFSKVFRYLPTPSGIGNTATSFARDVSDTLAPGAWGFGLMAIAGLLVGGFFWWRARPPATATSGDSVPAVGFALAGLLATTAMPLITTYWRDANHVRYLLPWLIFPGWFAMVWVVPKLKPLSARPVAIALLGLGFVGLAVAAIPRIESAKLRWPYSEHQARLDRFLTDRKLQNGLSDYWHAHEINTLSHAKVHLFPMRPDGRFSFWNNNAFWFFDENSGHLTVPRYDFILVDGLDGKVLTEKFGEPAERVDVDGTRFWLYSGASAVRMTELAGSAVKEFVRGRPGEEMISAKP